MIKSILDRRSRLDARAVLFVVLTLGLAGSHAEATDYYVAGASATASDSNPGTAAQPWKTITKANQTVAPGDTVYIKAGAYTNYIAPVRSGTASGRITYVNFGTDTVTIQNATYGIYLDGKSYVTVQGINFYNLDQFLWIQNSANHNTIAYCNFDQGRTVGWSGSKIYRSSSYNWVHHSRFSKYGYFDTGSHGTLLDIGNELSQTDFTSNNLLEDSQLYHAGHHVLGVYGMYNVIRRNVLHNENWSNGHGSRIVYVAGYEVDSGRNLIEGNNISYSGVPGESWGRPGLSVHTDSNIIRRNRFAHNNMPGVNVYTHDDYPQGPQNNRIYNNSFLHNGYSTSSSANSWYHTAISFVNDGTAWTITGNHVKNNVYWMHAAAHGFHNATSTSQTFAGNWNGETQGDPLFVNASGTLGDPMNGSLPDLHLKPGSPVIDNGVFLTTVASANGSGTTLQVADASYFIDGWQIVEGDLIQLQGTQQRARITAVDYASNTLTLDKSLTWTRSQGIALAYEGGGPDVGAYESNLLVVPSAPTNVRIVP